MIEKKLSEATKNKIRKLRQKICFDICDRAVWYDSLTAEQKAEIQAWRKACLDATKTGVLPAAPKFVK